MRALRRDSATLLLLGAEDEVSAGWFERFADDGPVPTVVRDLLHEVLVAASTSATPPRLRDTAYAVGVLRAVQGRTSVSLVEDVLSLRPHLWSYLAARPETQGDVGALLVAHQRLADVIDLVLRCAVDAFVEESQRALTAQATRDPLTGLLNRAAFEEALHHEVAASDRQAPPALLLMDLDGFKQVNGSADHLAGDIVLVEVARLLSASCRRDEQACRLGGDAFALLQPRPD